MKPLAPGLHFFGITPSFTELNGVDLGNQLLEPGPQQASIHRANPAVNVPPRSGSKALETFLNPQDVKSQETRPGVGSPPDRIGAKRKGLSIIIDADRDKRHKSRIRYFEQQQPSSHSVQTLCAWAEEKRTQAAVNHPIAEREKFNAEFASATSGFDQMHRTLAHMDAASATWESAADHFEAAQRQAHGLNLPQPSDASLAHPIDQCRANIARLDIKANLLKGVHGLMDHAAKLQMYTAWAAKKAAATPEGAFQMGHRARHQEYPGAYEETARYLNQALKICQSYDHATLPLTLFPIRSFDNELRHVAQRAEHLLDRLDQQDPDVLPSQALAHLACLQDWTPRFKQSCHDLMRTAQALKDALHGTAAPAPADPSDPLIQSLHALTLTESMPQEAGRNLPPPMEKDTPPTPTPAAKRSYKDSLCTPSPMGEPRPTITSARTRPVPPRSVLQETMQRRGKGHQPAPPKARAPHLLKTYPVNLGPREIEPAEVSGRLWDLDTPGDHLAEQKLTTARRRQRDRAAASQAAIALRMEHADELAALASRDPAVDSREPLWKTHCRQLAAWQAAVAAYQICNAELTRHDSQQASEAPFIADENSPPWTDLHLRVQRGILAAQEHLAAAADVTLSTLLEDDAETASPATLHLQFAEVGRQLRSSPAESAGALLMTQKELCAALEQGHRASDMAAATHEPSTALSLELITQLHEAALVLFSKAKAMKRSHARQASALQKTGQNWMKVRQAALTHRNHIENCELNAFQDDATEHMDQASLLAVSVIRNIQEVLGVAPLSETHGPTPLAGTAEMPVAAPHPHSAAISQMKQVSSAARSYMEQAMCLPAQDVLRHVRTGTQFRLLWLRHVDSCASAYLEILECAQNIEHNMKQATLSERKKIAYQFADRFIALRIRNANLLENCINMASDTQTYATNQHIKMQTSGFISSLRRTERLIDGMRFAIQGFGLLCQYHHEAQQALRQIQKGLISFSAADHKINPAWIQAAILLTDAQAKYFTPLAQKLIGAAQTQRDHDEAAEASYICTGLSNLAIYAENEKLISDGKLFLAWIKNSLAGNQKDKQDLKTALFLGTGIIERLSQSNRDVIEAMIDKYIDTRPGRALLNVSVNMLGQLLEAKKQIQDMIQRPEQSALAAKSTAAPQPPTTVSGKPKMPDRVTRRKHQ